MLWYIVVVFFTAGLDGPAHFEQNWYPQQVVGGITECTVAGDNVLNYLRKQTRNLSGEMFEVACILALDTEDLANIIHDKWTFEDAPTFGVPRSPPLPGSSA